MIVVALSEPGSDHFAGEAYLQFRPTNVVTLGNTIFPILYYFL